MIIPHSAKQWWGRVPRVITMALEEVGNATRAVVLAEITLLQARIERNCLPRNATVFR